MKKFKFSKKQADLLMRSIDEFQNDSVKESAKKFIGGKLLIASHSKGTYTQSYSRCGCGGGPITPIENL